MEAKCIKKPRCLSDSLHIAGMFMETTFFQFRMNLTLIHQKKKLAHSIYKFSLVDCAVWSKGNAKLRQNGSFGFRFFFCTLTSATCRMALSLDNKEFKIWTKSFCSAAIVHALFKISKLTSANTRKNNEYWLYYTRVQFRFRITSHTASEINVWCIPCLSIVHKVFFFWLSVYFICCMIPIYSRIHTKRRYIVARWHVLTAALLRIFGIVLKDFGANSGDFRWRMLF